MSSRFGAIVDPPGSVIDALGERTPRSPFNSAAYAAAARARGATPCAVALWDDGSVVGGAVGLLQGNTWNRSLTIPTAPALQDSILFWDGVVEFCREHGVCDLVVETFASTESTAVGALTRRAPRRSDGCVLRATRERFEYVLHLQDRDPAAGVSKHHRRSLVRARSAALVVTRTAAIDATPAHLAAMQASAARRLLRGEALPFPDDDALHRSLLECGAAELFQACVDGRVLASILVLRTAAGAYYQSAGTTSDGMKIGASPFLVLETAKLLAADGLRWFNLGGAAPDAEGLRRFKCGFGTEELQLESASFSMLSRYKRHLRRLAGIAKLAPRRPQAGALFVRASTPS